MRPHTKDIREVRFENPRLAKIGVEVLTLMRPHRLGTGMFASPERPDFYLLLLIRSGSGRHRVDFVEYRLRKGDVLFVRPGQVQQWRVAKDLVADLVLVSPEVLAPFATRAHADMKILALEDWATTFRLNSKTVAQAAIDVSRLRSDIDDFDGSALEAKLIWHELITLLLRLARERPHAHASRPGKEHEIYRMLLRELERRLDRRASVRQLARRIGYSESTLSRACLVVAGHTAKAVADFRVVLEAKRLLVHSDSTIADIAHKLGFTEPTNFVKFFRRLAGTNPSAFRRAQGLNT